MNLNLGELVLSLKISLGHIFKAEMTKKAGIAGCVKMNIIGMGVEIKDSCVMTCIMNQKYL